jgi:hypothetical protein
VVLQVQSEHPGHYSSSDSRPECIDSEQVGGSMAESDRASEEAGLPFQLVDRVYGSDLEGRRSIEGTLS